MPPDESEEIKNGQWMGVTVRSQGIGGKVCYKIAVFSILNHAYFILLQSFFKTEKPLMGTTSFVVALLHYRMR